MNSIWVVTQGSRDDNDDYSWAVAAFTSKMAAEAFEVDHQNWLNNMKIDHYCDCYEIPLNPDYGENGYVLVEKKGDAVIASPLLHVSPKWVYKAQPGEVVQGDNFMWVIVWAVSRLDAVEKASVLFDQNNQYT